MKNVKHTLSCLLLAVALLGVTATAQAQEKNDGVAVLWHFEVKDGMNDNFEAAVKQYHEYMADKPGRWNWTYLNALTGPNTGDYYARSGEHNWADLDVTHEWDEEAGEAFEMMVQPYIESAERMISVDRDIENLPENWEDIKFVNVTEWHVVGGKGAQFDAHLKTIHDHLMAVNWSGTYSITNQASGGVGSVVMVAGFHTSWADMAEPSPSFVEVLGEQMGEEEMGKLLSEFGTTFKDGSSVTYGVRSDLSY